jgi:hypothetical protein
VRGQPLVLYFGSTGGGVFKSTDYRPYIYKTSDDGETWTKIVNGIPDTAFTRVVREDPGRRGLLYAGTEFGLFVTVDGATRSSGMTKVLSTVVVLHLPKTGETRYSRVENREAYRH